MYNSRKRDHRSGTSQLMTGRPDPKYTYFLRSNTKDLHQLPETLLRT